MSTKLDIYQAHKSTPTKFECNQLQQYDYHFNS